MTEKVMYAGLPSPKRSVPYKGTLESTFVEYHIQLIGVIWMPAVECASTRRYTRTDPFGRWLNPPNWDNPEEELGAIEDHLMTDVGDFQELTDWQCTRITYTSIRKNENDVLTTMRSEVIRPWQTAENEEKYYALMFPES
ncbi:MAG: hypothetical protein C0P72_011280 [Clostridia bacterium]